MKKMLLDWGLLAFLVVMILTTLGRVRQVVSYIYREGFGWALKYGSLSFLFIIGLLILCYLVLIAKVRSLKPYLFLAGLAMTYGLILKTFSWLPAEQIHLIEYGAVGALAYRAIGNHTLEPNCTLLSTLFASSIGLVDELIQGLLPSRVYDPRDVFINAVSGLLGVLVARVIQSSRKYRVE